MPIIYYLIALRKAPRYVPNYKQRKLEERVGLVTLKLRSIMAVRHLNEYTTKSNLALVGFITYYLLPQKSSLSPILHPTNSWWRTFYETWHFTFHTSEKRSEWKRSCLLGSRSSCSSGGGLNTSKVKLRGANTRWKRQGRGGSLDRTSELQSRNVIIIWNAHNLLEGAIVRYMTDKATWQTDSN